MHAEKPAPLPQPRSPGSTGPWPIALAWRLATSPAEPACGWLGCLELIEELRAYDSVGQCIQRPIDDELGCVAVSLEERVQLASRVGGFRGIAACPVG